MGVFVTVGVTVVDGVIDGVKEIVGVFEGVIDIVGVIDGVNDGVGGIVGVIVGVGVGVGVTQLKSSIRIHPSVLYTFILTDGAVEYFVGIGISTDGGIDCSV